MLIALAVGVLFLPSWTTQIVHAQTAAVDVGDFYYAPASITVDPGTTVVWTSSGNVPHTVTSSTGVFTSGTQLYTSGALFSFTFTAPGSYPYYCEIHPNLQSGTVIVAAPPEPSPEPTQAPAPTEQPTQQPQPTPDTAGPTATATTVGAPAPLPSPQAPSPQATVRPSVTSTPRPSLTPTAPLTHDDDGDGSSNWWVFALIAIGAVGVAGGGAYVFMRRLNP